MNKIIASLNKIEVACLVNRLIEYGGMILDGKKGARGIGAEIFSAFSAVIPLNISEDGKPESTAWVNAFMADHVEPRLLVYKEDGTPYSFTSRQMKETALGAGLLSVKDYIDNDYKKRNADAKKAAQAEAEAAQAEAEDKRQRALAASGIGETAEPEPAQAEPVQKAAEMKAVDLLNILLNMPEMEKKAGTIQKWIAELTV